MSNSHLVVTGRMNVVAEKINESQIYIYEDHRFIVFVLWCYIHLGVGNKNIEPSPLVYFDKHDDASDITGEVLTKAIELRKKDPIGLEKEILSFVEWDLSISDDNWLKAAMELGLITDVVLVGGTNNSNFQFGENSYEDHLGFKHRIWKIGSLWNELDYQGCLSDYETKEIFEDLWKILGWNPDSGFENDKTRLFLDFDLDYFTSKTEDITLPWPNDVMFNLFSKRSYVRCGYSARDFLIGILERSHCVTIAKESPFCGGTTHSQDILDSLDEILWKGEFFRSHRQ